MKFSDMDEQSMSGNDVRHKTLVFARPLFLSVIAAALLFFPSSAILFDTSVLLTSVLALADLSVLITTSGSVRFSFVMALSILLGYSFGSLIYLMVHHTLNASVFQNFARDGLVFHQPGLSTAFSAALLASAILYTCSPFQRPLDLPIAVRALGHRKTERVFWVGLLIVVLAFAKGDLGYMGTTVAKSGHITALGSLSDLIVPPLAAYDILLISGHRTRLRKVLLSLGFLFLLATLVVMGRRYLLYTAVLCAISYHMTGRLRSERQYLSFIAWTVPAAAVMYGGFVIFYAIRHAISLIGGHEGLVPVVQLGLSQLHGSRYAILQAQLNRNVGSRPFILSYFGGLVGLHSPQVPVNGRELLYSLRIAIPSAFTPGKVASLPPTPEALIHPLYGIPVFDGPNSTLTAGFNDFGFLGAVIYPVGVATLFLYFHKWVRTAINSETIRVMVLFALLFQMLNTEQALSDVFVTVRNLLIIVVAISVLEKLPGLSVIAARKSPKTSSDV